ncbi:MAG TPA: hypothetical protein VE010_06535 [Thermoanaerobaculia bacterium]|nr:hypothetical protein [Thermoanaerobaculia bacterium]
MRKVTVAALALTFLVTGFVVAQVTAANAEQPKTFSIFPKMPAANAPAVAPAATPADTLQLNDKLALRVEGSHDGRVIGTLLTNVNGQWVEVVLASKNMRAVAR